MFVNAVLADLADFDILLRNLEEILLLLNKFYERRLDRQERIFDLNLDQSIRPHETKLSLVES